MKRCDKINHKGKMIVLVDLSNTKPDEVVAILSDAHKIIAQMPPKSVLILTDATNSTYNTGSLEAVKEFAVTNTPYIRASATIGQEDALRRLSLNSTVVKAAGRNIVSFHSREEALDWLVSQP